MSNTLREMTTDEIREAFLREVDHIVRHWAAKSDMSSLERCERVAFSILEIIDGGNERLPGFILAPTPTPDERKRHSVDSGENWWPENNNAVTHDIGCDLTEELSQLFRERR